MLNVLRRQNLKMVAPGEGEHLQQPARHKSKSESSVRGANADGSVRQGREQSSHPRGQDCQDKEERTD